MSPYLFTYFIAAMYALNVLWLAWHGQWVFAGYWASALMITVFSYLLASR